jgi:serine/threonine-protein kinase
LRKNPRARLHDIADARIDIEEIREAPGLDAHQSTERSNVWRRAAPWILAAMAVGVALWSWVRPEPATAPRRTKRFVISLPEDEPLALRHPGIVHPAFALSADGTGLAYVGVRDGVSRLYLRALDSFESQAVAGSEGAFGPFFSPDGRWVGFFSEGHLRKVSFDGGEPITLCEARRPGGATWGPGDTIFFSEGTGRILARVSADGGAPQTVSGGNVFWPATLPGGEELFISAPATSTVSWFSPRTGERRPLIEQGLYGRYLPTGHLLYVRPGRLMAVPFEQAALEIKGSPVPVLDGVRTEVYGAGQVSVSSDGTLVYVPGSAANRGSPVWVDSRGGPHPLGFPNDTYGTFQLSQDERRLAIEIIETQNVNIWIYDLERGARTRLTLEGNNRFPIWSPDGKWIVFGSTRGGILNMYKKAADGSGETIRLTRSENTQIPYSWSPDGKWLAYTETASGSLGDIWILPVDGGKAERLVGSPFHQSFPTFSPDGNWLAYTSDESGRMEVYVRRFPAGSGGRTPISIEGGTKPVWSANGDELTFHSGSRILSVAIDTEPDLVVGTARTLFDGSFVNANGRAHDVSGDGQRLLILQPSAPATATRLNVIVNWHEELKRLVPTN